MTPTPLTQAFGRIQRSAFGIGAVGTALMALGFFLDREQFHRSWLMGYLFWLAPTLGSLAIVMLHNLTGGGWGFAIKRLLEAAIRNVPLIAVLFLPILFGIHQLFEWSDAEVVEADPILQHKALYLNEPFFIGRAIFYFLVWGLLGFLLVRLSSRYDRKLDISALRSLKGVSGLGIVAYVLTMSFASFDWAMSLEPHWFSTLYGLHFVVGQGLSTLCFAIVAASRLARHEPFSRWIERSHFHDLGNLLLAFVMLWAYAALSQFLIIWSGNLPEETPYYLTRFDGPWQVLSLGLAMLHFAVPFVVLLNRRSKRNAQVLATLAGAIFLLRYLDFYWLVAPAFHHGVFHFSWMDLVSPVAIGGLWIGFFVHNLRNRPLVSLQDAKLLGSLEEASIA